MRLFRLLPVVATILVTTTSVAQAQTGETPPLGAFFAANEILISTKPRAPFSAVIAEQQTLNDGTKIGHNDQEVIVRDGQGRLYREQKRPWEALGQSGSEITISDPIRRFQYVCQAVSKHCTKLDYQPLTGIRRPTAADAGRMRKATLEDLGTENISGVVADGIRVTQVIAEGVIGNDRPITIKQEMWYSRELDADIQFVRTDPRFGTRTRTLTEVVFGEPDPKYFQLPAGFAVQDMRAKAGKGTGAQ